MISDLFVTDRGEGPVVLAVHGQPGFGGRLGRGGGRSWSATTGCSYRTAPATGAPAATPWDMAANADLLADLLVDRATGPATVVGHSYGGGIAALLAARHPELVSGLVLVGFGGPGRQRQLSWTTSWPCRGPARFWPPPGC